MCRLGDGPPGKWAGPSRRDWTKQGSWVPGLTLERAENGERIIMYCVPVGASRRLRWGCLGLAAIVAMLAVTTDPADARRRRKRSHGKLASISSKLQPALRRHRGRRQERRGAACGGPRRAAPPGLADQDHDALSAVRASGVRQDRARHADGGVRGGLEPGADQARSRAGRHAQGRGRDQGPRHQVGQRRRGGDRRGARRQRGRVRPRDDAQGPRARHAQHHLPQCQRPAERRSDHHRARSGAARHRDPGALPEILPVFFAGELRLSRQRHAQPQPSARQGRGRRRHQDRLHPGFRLQSRDLGQARRLAISSPWCWAAAPPAAATRACAN